MPELKTRVKQLCEDYPCCGHTRLDPCDGQPPALTVDEFEEAFYCDQCGYAHRGECYDPDYEPEDEDYEDVG